MVDPVTLRQANLSYREPALYDGQLADDPTPERILRLADRHAPRARSLLDLGCGTGRTAALLHEQRGWHGTGIDAQPDLLAYARRRHPQLDVMVGDITTARLPSTFDVIISVGNTLSYLSTPQELDAVFESFRVHSHTGTLLTVATMHELRPADGSGGSFRVDTTLGLATVESYSTWNPHTRELTTERTWLFENTGRLERDLFTRHVWPREELEHLAILHEFRPLARRCTTDIGLSLAAIAL